MDTHSSHCVEGMGGRCLGGRLEEGWIGKRDAAMHDYKGTLRDKREEGCVEMGIELVTYQMPTRGIVVR